MYRSPGTCSAGGSTASILPRSTSTVRGSRPCWITPATMSPSCPAYSPKVISSSTSRSRCRITCRAVVAAIRPNPAGVSSYSRPVTPSSLASRAQTVTWPVARFTSTREAGLAPSVLWYAISSASSIALMAVSDEMSFSFSRLRSTLRSMSIAASSQVFVVFVGEVRIFVFIFCLAEFGVRNPPELDLDGARAQLPQPEPALALGQVERDAAGIRREYPALHRSLAGHLDLDQPADRAPPVPRLGQRAVHPGRGHLQGVRHLAERVALVEQGGDLAADVGRVVEADPVVAVHHDAQQPPPARDGHPHGLKIHSGRGDHGLDQLGQPLVIDRADRRTGATGHLDLLVRESPNPLSPRLIYSQVQRIGHGRSVRPRPRSGGKPTRHVGRSSDAPPQWPRTVPRSGTWHA